MSRYPVALFFLVLTPISLALFLSFDYSGDYAINDDWGYSTPIRWWSSERQFNLTHWQSMPLITQLALGTVWSELFGFSQGTLRQLTVSLAIISCMTVFVCARYLDMRPALCAICALLPLSSPIFVGLSYSFMTDIPAIAIVMLASLFFVRSLKEVDDVWYYSLGVVFLLLAVLLRQTSVALALALIIAEPVAKGFHIRRFFRSLVVLASTIVVYLVATKFLEASVGLPRAYGAKTDALLSFVSDVLALNLGAFRKTLEALVFAISQFGLFVLPLLPIFLGVILKGRLRYLGISVIGAVLLLLASINMGVGVIFQEGGNILTADGIGPRTIRGEASVNIPISWAITALSHFGFLSALMAGSLAIREKSRSSGYERAAVGSILFLVLTAIISFAPHTIAYAAVFDRYALLPSVLLMLCVTWAVKDLDISRVSIPMSAIFILVGFCVSLGLTADFFRWQDARYTLIDRLISDGYTETDIDGGFEFNNLAAVLSDQKNAVSMLLVEPEGRSVRITRSVSPGDEVIASESYTGFFGSQTGTIYAVR